MRDWKLFPFLFLLCCSAQARRHTFASFRNTNSGLTYVKNSGVCETTPGVGQISGYINIAATVSMWFWFFEARNSPDTAPLTLWLNGGPGCSSMIGLFLENGPCTVNSDGETVLNPHSWNNISNMIYIDSPPGAGFSTGAGTVSNTDDAAEMIWVAFQILFESPEFSAFQSRRLIFATESYGGHMAPVFIAYFNSQNALIDRGELSGQKIIFTSLMINNGKHDPLIQYASYITFAQDAPGYGPLQNATVTMEMSDAFYAENGCRAQLEDCYTAGTERTADAVCAAANNICNDHLFYPAVRGYQADDLRQSADNITTFPPKDYKAFLKRRAVMDLIGATVNYQACNSNIKHAFAATGEFGRSFLPPLAALADAHFPILIWVGDADIKANWIGVHESMVSMSWYGNQTLNSTAFTTMTIDGTPVAEIKSVDSFTFSRVFGAGHALPAFVPATALEFFSQVVAEEEIHSVPTTTESAPSPSASAFARGSAPSRLSQQAWWWAPITVFGVYCTL